MNRDEILTIVIEMIGFHKELQDIEKFNNNLPILEEIFKVPETGYFNSDTTYKIDEKGVYVVTMKRSYRYLWKEILPYTKHINQQYLLF